MSETTLNIFAIILLMTLVQALLFAIILSVRAWKLGFYADRWLAILVAIMGLASVPHLLGWLGIAILWNNFTFYPWNGLELAVLPTVFLFLQSRLNVNWRFHWQDLKYYLLYLVYFIYHFAVAIQGKIFAKWWWFEINNRYNIDAVFSFCNAFLFAFFIARFYKIYRYYQTWTSNHYSNLPMLSIAWIRNFIVAYFLFILTDVSLTIMELMIGAQYDKMWWAYLSNFLLTYYVSIYGLYQKPIASLDFKIPKMDAAEDTNIEKKLFTAEEINIWKAQITAYLTQTKPYLNHELRLSEIAQHFNVNVSTFSTLINLCYEQNFNDLINTYRVNTFLQKIKDGELEKFTLLSIAYDSGFNSKTTFNRVFKKHIGISPSNFIKK